MGKIMRWKENKLFVHVIMSYPFDKSSMLNETFPPSVLEKVVESMYV